MIYTNSVNWKVESNQVFNVCFRKSGFIKECHLAHRVGLVGDGKVGE